MKKRYLAMILVFAMTLMQLLAVKPYVWAAIDFETVHEHETYTSGFEQFYYNDEYSFVTIKGTVVIDASNEEDAPAMGVADDSILTLYLTKGSQLILKGGSNAAGLHVSEFAVLNIIGEGKLVATGGTGGAGIGGNGTFSAKNSGEIYIYGGEIIANGTGGSAGIGGGAPTGDNGGEGFVYIFGGDINATGGNGLTNSAGGAGIGAGGGSFELAGGSGVVEVYGGNIKAKGGNGDNAGGGAGIGGGGGAGHSFYGAGGMGYVNIYSSGVSSAFGGSGNGGGAGIGGGGGIDIVGYCQMELAYNVDLTGKVEGGSGIYGYSGAKVGGGGSSNQAGQETQDIWKIEDEDLRKVSVIAAGGGTAFGSGVLGSGIYEAAVFAIPKEGYYFKNWEVSDAEVILDDETSVFAFTESLDSAEGNVIFTAVFEELEIPEFDVISPEVVNGCLPISGEMVIVFDADMNTERGTAVLGDMLTGTVNFEWQDKTTFVVSYSDFEEGMEYSIVLNDFIAANGGVVGDIILIFNTNISDKPDDGKPDDGDPDEGDPDEGDPDEGDPDDGDPDEGDPDEGDPDDGDPDEGDQIGRAHV